MPAQILTPVQERTLEGMIEMGLYHSKSEALRASVASLVAHMPLEVRLGIAVAVYRKGDTSISVAAMIAGIPFNQMRDHLRDEGVLRVGFTDPGESVKAGKKLARLMKGE